MFKKFLIYKKKKKIIINSANTQNLLCNNQGIIQQNKNIFNFPVSSLSGGSLFSGSFSAMTGLLLNFETDYDKCVDVDKRPDFEKAYDIYLQNNPLSEGDNDPKKLFAEAAKISWAMARLKNE